ncbi:hypothetical protein BH11PLA2_BH11PLA2_28310 [soil metagenome]
MSTKQDFLKAIWDQPHDDLPRLVYADWLEEQGDAARAEFIRLQCEHARTEKYEDHWYTLRDRVEKLWKKHKKTWQAELPESVRKYRFERGFVSPNSKIYTASAFTSLDPSLIEAAPFWKIELRGNISDLVKAAKHPHMGRVSHLNYDSSGHPHRHKDGFFTQGHLHNLSRLLLRNPNADDATVEALIDNCHRIPHLKQLQIGYENEVTSSGINKLAQSPILSGLTHLLMPSCYLTAESFKNVIQSPGLANCRSLLPPARRLVYENRSSRNREEYDVAETSAIIEAVGNSKEIPKLTSLQLDHCHNESSKVLFDTSPIFQLRELTIWTGYDAQAEYFEKLAHWPGLQSLRTLIFLPSFENVEAAKLIADSPYLGQLRALGYYHHFQLSDSRRETIDQTLLSRFEKSALFQPEMTRTLLD